MPKISALPAAASVNLTDILPEVSPASGGTTYKATFQQVYNAFALGGAALTRTNDTNVTLTLGGSPATALLNATSITAGWSGSLSVARGGTGQTSFTNGQLLIGNTTGNTLTPATLTAGTNITIGNSTGSITISGVGEAGFGWTDVTGTTQAMAVSSGYVADNAGLVTLTLPAVAAFGARVSVVGSGAGGWLIAQNALQVIHLGSATTTVGVGGSLASTNRWDSIQLICVIANTTWTCLGSPVGNITIV